jgi:hypothetical protein
MCSVVAILLMTASILHPCFAQRVFSEYSSLADRSANIPENIIGQRQSLAAILRKETPTYLRDVRGNLPLAATGAAWGYNLPISFFLNLIRQESSFRPRAISAAGALGIAQFMPSVANWRGLNDPFEPQSALTEAARYLSELRNRFGNLGLAAAAYNAGPTRVRQFLEDRRALPAETQHYVLAITGATVADWVISGHHEIKLAVPLKDKESAKRRSRTETVMRTMPQPHQFAIGKPVPSEILMSERVAAGHNRWQLITSR